MITLQSVQSLMSATKPAMPVRQKKQNSNWTEEKLSYLFSNYGKLSPAELELNLGIKRSAIAQQAYRLGLRINNKSRGRKSQFTDTQDSYIIKHYGQSKNAIEIAEDLGFEPEQIRSRYHNIRRRKAL